METTCKLDIAGLLCNARIADIFELAVTFFYVRTFHKNPRFIFFENKLQSNVIGHTNICNNRER